MVWAKAISGPYSWYQAAGATLDRQDNFYYASSFANATFLIGNQTMTNRSKYSGTPVGLNGFIAKFSKAGDFLWAQQIGGDTYDFAGGCAADTNGNVFVTGGSMSTNIELGGIVLTNSLPEPATCFLAKYDPQGNLLWARQSSGGEGDVWGMSVAVGVDGSVWLAGTFDSSNVVFGAYALTNAATSQNNPKFQDFIVKYSSSGSVLWAEMITVNAGGQTQPSLALDTNGNAFFCDDFVGIADLGSTTVTNTSNGGYQAALLAKFDPAGNVLWAEQAAYPTTGGGIFTSGLAVDAQGSCRIAGSYYSCAAVFPSNSLPATIGSAINGFLAKFDASGAFLWADASIAQQNACVRLDAIGNSYVVGFNTVSKYTSDGTLLWSTNPIGQYLSVGAADPSGNVFFIGIGGIVYSAGELSGPLLNIQPSGNQVVISWPTNEVGLSLGSAPTLSGPWSPVTNPLPAVIGNQYFVTNNVSPGSQYFRLGNF